MSALINLGMKKWVVVYFLWTVSIPVVAQSKKIWTKADRNNALVTLNKEIHIPFDTTIRSQDSSILIHYKNGVFLINKHQDSVDIKEFYYLRKQKNGKSTLLFDKKDVFEGFVTDVLPRKAFVTLFDITQAFEGGYVAKNTFTASAGIDPSTVYIQSWGGNQALYNEVQMSLIKKVGLRMNSTLKSFLEYLISKSDHWNNLQALVKKNGFGDYFYGSLKFSLDFQYKQNQKFRIKYPSNKLESEFIPRL